MDNENKNNGNKNEGGRDPKNTQIIIIMAVSAVIGSRLSVSRSARKQATAC